MRFLSLTALELAVGLSVENVGDRSYARSRLSRRHGYRCRIAHREVAGCRV